MFHRPLMEPIFQYNLVILYKQLYNIICIYLKTSLMSSYEVKSSQFSHFDVGK